MYKRKLGELNLLDDFLFNKMVSHPEYGELFSKELLRIILGKEIGKLKVVPQKVYYGSDTDRHGARLDVYLEEDPDSEDERGNATIYDVEPEKGERTKDKKTLPRRSRFYHSIIDAGILKSGEEYQNLKNVIVILIMPDDPLGADRMVYTIESRCRELPDMPYDDGAKTLMLYTRGTEGNPPEELRELLKYVEQTCEENAKNDALKKMHEMVESVKQEVEVSREYMKIFEREQMLREEGIEIGRKQERKRAEAAEKRTEVAERKIAELEQIIAELTKNRNPDNDLKNN